MIGTLTFVTPCELLSYTQISQNGPSQSYRVGLSKIRGHRQEGIEIEGGGEQPPSLGEKFYTFFTPMTILYKMLGREKNNRN